MPKLNNPEIKIKKTKNFKRPKIRPWDDPDNFLPKKLFKKRIKFATSKQLDNNKTTIGKQLDNNKTTIGKQLDNNKITIGKQLDNNKITIGKQLDNELDNNWITAIKQTIEPIQQEFKPLNIGYEKTLKAIKKLFGLQKKAFLFIVENCRSTGTLCSNQITNETFRKVLNTDVYSVKTTIYRLVKKEFLKRIEGKKGIGGYTIFSINESILDATLELNRQEQLCDKLSNIAILDKVTIGKQLDNELDNNRVTTRETTSHVVSSSYINTTTYIPTEFEKIDFFPLSDIGFDESHIIQIYREHKKNPELSLSPEIIQNSINAFAFDLKHNKIAGTFKNSPAVVLTSLLKKGQPYSSKTPEKVLTPQEEAMQEYLLAQEKKQQKIIEIKIKAREIALQGWLDSLSEEELLNFNQELRPDGIPDRIYQKSRRKKAEELAKDYFDAVLWPKQLKQILNPQVSLNETES